MSDRGSKRKRKPLLWLADDSPMERLLTERTLGDQYDYERFSDGAEVIEKLAEGKQPDALIVDWVMPGVAGDEVCRYVRAERGLEELPIILLTASRIETTDIVAGLASGANDYVARPFASEELRARVASVLRTRQLSDSAAYERARLASLNHLGRALFAAGSNVDQILEQLATILTESICDGCAVLLIPGVFPGATYAKHRTDTSGSLGAISTIADPVVHAFGSADQALATLPPVYHNYVRRHGLSGLAILPLPVSAPVQGVVTVTRDGASEPFDADDISAIETCIDYVNLALQNAMRFDIERLARYQLHTVLERLPIGIVVTDVPGNLTLVNPAASQLIPGIDKTPDVAGVFGLGTWSTTNNVPILEQDWAFGQAQPKNAPLRTECMLETAPGTVSRLLSISTVPLTDGRGLPIGNVTAIDDVTADRVLSAERERIAHFQEQMLAIVGHDLRTPLGAIVAGTEVLAMRARDLPPIISLATRISSSADRMIHIVDQLLDVTRARLGSGIPISPRTTQLVTVARVVVDEMTLAHPASTFELIATSEITGNWDADRLSQVVSNLASNAVQYGRVGSPIIIELASTAKVATITVTNSLRDKPIPHDILSSLFDPYRRGREDGNTTGLGLGLYIVHEIVRAHGGTIQAESTDAGTVFHIQLPLE